MKKVLREHHISFKNAFSGLFWAVRTQPNFRIHGVLSLLALLLAWFFRISPIELTIIIFTIVLGLVVEMLNTALESMTDLITTEWRTEAKIAKDVAAGMMLLSAIGAATVGVVIFWPYVIQFLI